MKGIVTSIAFILATTIGYSANSHLVNQKIEQNFKTVNLSSIELDEAHENFVIVSFEIIDGNIEIQEMNSSSSDLESIVLKRLSNIHIESPYCENKRHAYKFVFTKS